jgi:hypothetical protein
MSVELGQEAAATLRIGHLAMVQGIVGRLAGYSAAVKNFSVTLLAGVLVAAIAEGKTAFLWIAVIGAVLFALMDAYYLAMEKAYRRLHEEVSARPLADADQLGLKRGSIHLGSALRSWSVWPFYLTLIVGGLTPLIHEGLW